MEVIAHRAGNRVESIAGALAVADGIELDVHRFRGRLEVRHAKVAWPFALRWDGWSLIGREVPRPTLAEILASVPDGAGVWLDLKGFDRILTRRVLAAAGGRYRLTVSSRSWWVLAPARRGDVRVMRSVGNRAQLWLVRRRVLRRSDRVGDGVVLHERFATPEMVTALRRHPGPLITWAVEGLDRVDTLRRLGIDGVIADDLELIAAIGMGT